MKALVISGLALALIPMSVQARPARQRVPGTAHAVMAPLEEAATTCFAETVLSNPRATTLARDNRWYEAAGVIGFLCRPEVGRMVRAHDGLYGPGTGERYFKGAYAQHLDKQLAARLQPLLTTQAVASAEPPIEKTALTGEPAEGVEAGH